MNAGTGLNISFSRYEDRLAEIFKGLAANGRGIELNTSGYRYNGGVPMPPPELVKLYRDCGGEIITVGSDAHYTKHVGANIRDGYELLSSVGFKYVTVFEKRRPKFIAL
jgi:histidinol-phosphatase (PHP family)